MQPGGIGTSRYELKQSYPETNLAEVRSWVNAHPDGFKVTYPSRQVNSLYFDTPDLVTMHDHIDGVAVRRKLRYRWYGSNLSIGENGQVEVKNKSELAGWKIVQPLTGEFHFLTSGWASLMQQFRIASTGLVLELLSVARPVVLTVYQRDYYVSADGDIRLTIDYGLRAYDQHFRAAPNIIFPQIPDNLLILELKSDIKKLKVLSESIAHFPVRTERYSKFITGMLKDGM